MSINTPLIDDRKYDDIAKQALALTHHYCPPWQGGQNIQGNNDPGKALIYLFARLLEILITRLNRLPEKYFLAFLDYIGARLRPPIPAKTLLQFTLSQGAESEEWIPPGTRAAGEETRNQEEQLFETLEAVTISPVNLNYALRFDPSTGENSDYSTMIAGIGGNCGETVKTPVPIDMFAACEIDKTPDFPGFYLGFDAPFSSDTHGLFFQVEENTGNARCLQWEYSVPGGWKSLKVKDDTRNLSQPGHVRFIVPGDCCPRQCSGIDAYWLRVLLIRPAEPFSPKLSGVYWNTVWAENAITIKDELLGSSNGSANQDFCFSRSPLLPGQQIWVIEREMPGDEEIAQIIKEEGEGAIQVTRDEKGMVTEIRVCWHEVNNFYASGPRSRHYVLEAAGGWVCFGDGSRGMVPPIGRDNIICSVYRTGGGAAGNVGVGQVTELKTALPYIDQVVNVLPGVGGMDGETLDEILERGPHLLKHRERAVTVEDFEWLMKEAPGDIALCKCLPAKDWQTGGKIEVIIVPDRDDPKPEPSPNLILEVEQYLYERCRATLISSATNGISSFQVKGPGYLEVSVEAVIVPLDSNRVGEVEKTVIARLEQFFHPLKGGPEGRGWAFGRAVYLAEVMQVLQNTPGVDYIKSVTLNGGESNSIKSIWVIEVPPRSLVYSGEHHITVEIEL